MMQVLVYYILCAHGYLAFPMEAGQQSGHMHRYTCVVRNLDKEPSSLSILYSVTSAALLLVIVMLCSSPSNPTATHYIWDDVPTYETSCHRHSIIVTFDVSYYLGQTSLHIGLAPPSL